MRSSALLPWEKALWETFITTLSIFISTSFTLSVTVAPLSISESGARAIVSIVLSPVCRQISRVTSLYPIIDTRRV